MSEFLNDLFKL